MEQSTEQASKLELTPLAARLMFAAMATWLVSLALPAFIAGHHIYVGAWAGLLGVLFGSAVMGWAAYANIAFWLAIRALWRGRPAGAWLTVMWLLAASLPFFHEVFADEGGGRAEVSGWGWGAALWIYSMVLVTGATLARDRWKARWSIGLPAIVLVAAGAPLAFVHASQRREANAQERVTLIPHTVAFTREKFCGIELSMPAGRLIPAGESAALEIADDDLAYRPDAGYFRLPELPRLRDGDIWEKSRPWGFGDSIEVRQPGRQPRFVLTASRSAEGGVLRLTDREQSRILYEQRLGLLVAGNSREFCPGTTTPDSGAPGYDDALNLALGIPDAKPSMRRPEIFEDRAEEHCEIAPGPLPNVRAVKSWDGREVILDSGFDKLTGRCSTRYALLVSVQRAPADRPYSAMVAIYDRATLRALRHFGQLWCHPDNDRCESLAARDITAVRVTPNEVTVETSVGEFQLH